MYDAGLLKSTKNQHKNNSQQFSTTATSLRGYGLVEVTRRHSPILCFLIFNQSNISGDSKISNYIWMVIFEANFGFAKPSIYAYYISINRVTHPGLISGARHHTVWYSTTQS